MEYYIGVDIGTSSTKAAAFSAAGSVLARHSIGYPILHPQQDRSEQQQDIILAAVISCLQNTASQLAGHNPVLVSFSAAMHSLVLMDDKGGALTECIIWADNRASNLAEGLRETEQGKGFYNLSGVPIHAMSPFCKLLWFKENEPELFTATAKFIGIKEFIFYRLFGKYVIDTAIASATGFINTHSLQWEPAILNYAGIAENLLSTIVPTTHIEYLQAGKQTGSQERLHAFKQTAFVIGSSDGGLANLGTGATVPGSMAVTIGTSSAVRLVVEQAINDSYMRTFCYHLTGTQYVIGGASNNGAFVIQWLKENILQNNDSYGTFINLAQAVPAGSNELIFLPYILGERAPIWNANARGVYFGLSSSHTTAHLIRAALEAVMYNTYAIGKTLMEKKTVTIIYANGGFADSPFWIQMLADMFNLPVFIPAIEESSALGAVIVGMEALKIPATFDMGKGTHYQPNAANHAIYLQGFTKMERLYRLLKSEF